MMFVMKDQTRVLYNKYFESFSINVLNFCTTL